MNRITCFLHVLLLSIASFGQISILPYDSIIDLPADREHRISAQGWADYNSSSVYNELPWNIYQGGFIDRDLRERSRDVLRGTNSAGYEVGAQLSWVGADSLFGKARLRPLIAIGYRNLLGASFTRDAYELAFFGNAHYEDRVAELSPSAHTQIAWESVGFGIQDVKTRSFIRIDAIRGRSYNATDIRRADLYTAPDGRVLELDSDASYWSTDTAGKGFEHTNGLGVALSGKFILHGAIGQLPTEFSIAVNDAGFVQWNPNSVRIEREKNLVYEGIQVDNIFDLDNIMVGGDQLLDTFGLRYQHGSFTTLLPVRVALNAEASLDEFWNAGVSVDHRYIPGYKPQVQLNASRRFGEHVLLGMNAAYGGFGVLRFGLASRIRIGEFLLLELGSTHVPGFFIGTTRGVGAYLGLSAGF